MKKIKNTRDVKRLLAEIGEEIKYFGSEDLVQKYEKILDEWELLGEKLKGSDFTQI